MLILGVGCSICKVQLCGNFQAKLLSPSRFLQQQTYSDKSKGLGNLTSLLILGVGCSICKVQLCGNFQAKLLSPSRFLQQQTYSDKSKGLAVCFPQTASPIGCLNNLHDPYLSNFLGGTTIVPACFLSNQVARYQVSSGFSSEFSAGIISQPLPVH